MINFLKRIFTPEATPRKAKPGALSTRGFAGALAGPQLEDWSTPQTDIDSRIESGGAKLRNRARALEDDNAYFPQYLRELESNILGESGITLKVEGVSDAIANTVEDGWQEFSKRQNFSTSRQQNRLEFGRLALRSVARDGDCLIEIHRNFPKNPHRIAFQGFEADFVPLEASDDKRRIRMGVESDDFGEPTAFYRFNSHPGQSAALLYGLGMNRTRRVEAETVGETNTGTTALLPMLRKRFGQTRGFSWASAAIKMLRQLEKTEEGILIRKRIAAAQMGFFTHPDDDPEGLDLDEDGGLMIDLEPGSFHDIGRRGFTPFNPSDSNDYEQFRKGILRGVATSLGISYCTLANDLEGVSYSSIRQGVLTERSVWTLLQKWWTAEVEGPLFDAWLESAILSGSLNVPFSAFRDIQPVFNGRKWDWIDPQKDVAGAVEAINNDLSSKQRENRKRGQSPREIAAEREKDRELFGDDEPEAPGIPDNSEEKADDEDNVTPMKPASVA